MLANGARAGRKIKMVRFHFDFPEMEMQMGWREEGVSYSDIVKPKGCMLLDWHHFYEVLILEKNCV